ncbi:MAG TPA: DUF4389 domain-containing protein [Rhizomicrobium sp.]|jgi:hypothetical protein|nr:DUF4389 domain-containing protein [Rhizomicrobium sp.]
MADAPSGEAQSLPVAPHTPFPAARLLYAFGFAIVAWFVFWVLLFLGLAQFVILAVNGRVNAELKGFSLSLVQYLWEVLAFITFVRDEQPFPFAPFPKPA